MMKNILTFLLLMTLAVGSFGQVNRCGTNTCPDAETYCFDGTVDNPQEAFCIPIGNKPGNCSLNRVLACAEFATCKESDDHLSFHCECAPPGTGNGYNGPDDTGCQLPFKTCVDANDCPEHAKCEDFKCLCEFGFNGDGFNCTDIDECAAPDYPCDPNADCINNPGGYLCICKAADNFIGDGKSCKRICQSMSDCDAPRAICNIDAECECRPGYYGDGTSCVDINECRTLSPSPCSPNGHCVNEEPGYTCECNNGYTGDGYDCQPLPKNCAEIPRVRNRGTYLIDPDFEGPANAFEVECARVRGVIVTRVYPKGTFPRAVPENSSPMDIDYEPSPDDIKPLLEDSGYCSQDIAFTCEPGFALFPGTKVYDAYGNVHENWGSSHYQQCACGEVQSCDNRCLCSGDQTKIATDKGTIVDKSRLPVQRLQFSQAETDRGRIQLGPVACSEYPVGIPIDCHQAKFTYRKKKNTPLYIDVDGPQAPSPPFLVFCDMESYDHVGVTVIPTTDPNITVTDVNGEPVEYSTDLPKIEALIAGSAFCSQRIEFQCTSSSLSGPNRGRVSVTSDVQTLDYFPGGDPSKGGCACGATNSCEDPSVKCNCDIEDGKARKDFGLITERSKLPAVKVTAEIGGQRSSQYVIGNLRCSQKQFGIEPNCAKYKATGIEEDYSYLIDSDGTGPLPPFTVECKFIKNPSQGVTIINHLELVESGDIFTIAYLQANGDQIEALKTRSTMCIQEVRVDCKKFKLTLPAGSLDFTPLNAQIAQSLPDFLETCSGDQGCNCDQNPNGEAFDAGTVANKTYLPIISLDSSDVSSQLSNPASSFSLTVGPLVCSEIFPTCAALKAFVDGGNALEGEASVVSGKFTIDPDGAGGVEPFEVECGFPVTTVNVAPENATERLRPDGSGRKSVCYDINYSNENGDPISPAQIDALVKASGRCTQGLSVLCQNAPVSGMINFTTCDGVTQPGWAGSFGEDGCACSVSGNCIGGPLEKCNCDINDNEMRSDAGKIIDTDRLPVCQICLAIDDPVQPSPTYYPYSVLKYKLDPLKCDPDKRGFYDCQLSRPGNLWADMEMSVIMNGATEFPVGCRWFVNPPVGILVVKPKQPIIGNETDTAPVDITITYITFSIKLISDRVKKSRYCSQKLFFYCADENDRFELGGNYALYDYYGNVTYSWTELSQDGPDVQASCDTNRELCDRCGKPRGFLIPDKEFLPIKRIVLPATGVVLGVDEVECFELERSCQHIMDAGNKWIGYAGGSRYSIDPDLAGPLRPFEVQCEFDNREKTGVTQVPVSGEWMGSVNVRDQTDDPATFELPVEYTGATPEQINALAQISNFCWQGVKYECTESPLLGDRRVSYYNLYNNNNVSSFGTGPEVNYPGCACDQVGFCTSGFSCNCDALGPMTVDQGAITDKGSLPVTSVFVGGQGEDSEVDVQVTNVRCSGKTYDIPKDCAEALERGSKFGIDYTVSSEYLIDPSGGAFPPVMVRCDFDISPGNGVTVVRPDVPPNDPWDGAPNEREDVPYKGPNYDQIKALVMNSEYCYQGVRYDCQSTAFTNVAKWFSVDEDYAYSFWGGGDRAARTCACGNDKSCGGLDSARNQIERNCNCDVADDVPRSDAGIIDDKETLPVRSIRISRANVNVNITIGDLYCSQEPLEFNECEMGFSDCDVNANCVDQRDGYRCECKPGWQGKGVVQNTRQARANGRECFDDDECVAYQPCPYSATCTNLLGDFNCTCKPGYIKTGKTTCQDIDECADPQLNDCDPNARCENLDGSYRCLCEKGYRGNGRECRPVGLCTCFGDPHCKNYDNEWIHHQGVCKYVMSQDGCQPGDERNFRVIIETWKKGDVRPGYYSYVKTVFIETLGVNVTFTQNQKFYVNGVMYNEYMNGYYTLSILKYRQKLRLKTIQGLEVVWDGIDMVEVTVPKNVEGNACGLCGNFDGDPSNDLTLGPACPELEGTATENVDLFGDSWAVLDDTCEVDCSDTEPPPQQCATGRTIVERECELLFDLETSPFKECLAKKTPEELFQWRTMSCEYDLCAGSTPFDVKVCRFAELIARDCLEVELVSVIGWRAKIEQCGEEQCDNNMVYKCGPSIIPTCTEQNPEDDDNPCVEGCFCPDGMMMEVDRCVMPEECGCNYNGGQMAVGDEQFAPDCSKIIKCVEHNRTDEIPVECGSDEECANVEGVVGCFCRNGMRRDPVTGGCVVDDCSSVECPANMTCANGVCSCVMGYIGDCNSCKDIDECETDSTTCNFIGQKCVNTEGSFYCDCGKGYVPNGERCKDVDECKLDLHDCGENAECVNTLGSFTCECCVGYKSSPSGCITDPSVDASGQKCCACKGDKCKTVGKVCGTDGKTYNSYRAMAIAGCKENKEDLRVEYYGRCQDNCDTVRCKKQFSTCEMVDGGVPQCVCPSCENSSSSYTDTQVCASNKITYESICHMEKVNCEAEVETIVTVVAEGQPCPGKGQPPIVGPWSEFGECSEQCRQGVRVRTRNVVVDEGAVSEIHDREELPCYNTCDTGPCTDATCSEAKVCVVGDDGEVSCECPECGDFADKPVCTRIGNVIQTMDTECAMRQTACYRGEPDFEILSDVSCEDKPINCSVVFRYDYIKDRGDSSCKSTGMVKIGECYGGCDMQAKQCCTEISWDVQRVTFACENGRTYTDNRSYYLSECDCRDEPFDG